MRHSRSPLIDVRIAPLYSPLETLPRAYSVALLHRSSRWVPTLEFCLLDSRLQPASPPKQGFLPPWQCPPVWLVEAV